VHQSKINHLLPELTVLCKRWFVGWDLTAFSAQIANIVTLKYYSLVKKFIVRKIKNYAVGIE